MLKRIFSITVINFASMTCGIICGSTTSFGAGTLLGQFLGIPLPFIGNIIGGIIGGVTASFLCTKSLKWIYQKLGYNEEEEMNKPYMQK